MSINKKSSAVLLICGALTLGLSACTIQPINPDGRVAKVTEKIADGSASLWQKTIHVLRLDGTDFYNGDAVQASAKAGESTDEFTDEVDLALINGELPADQSLATADGELVILSPVADTDGVINTSPVVQEIQAVVSSETLQAANSTPADTTDTTTQPSVILAQAPLPDYQHTVAENETLWVLSKQLTGDATNWKILAELNNLGPDGIVFPEMTLTIPADMLKNPVQPRLLADDSNATPSDSAVIEVTSNERVKVPSQAAIEAVAEVVAVESTVFAGPKTSFGVQAGETMWDLAKRTTGDATNWKAIAAANSMSEKDATFIKYGQNIDVPDNLLKSADSVENIVAEAGSETAEPVLAAANESQQPVSTEIQTGVSVAAAMPLKDNAVASASADDLKIIPTTFKSDPPTINETAGGVAPALANEQKWITVSGTYYPKAVYNDANFSASLLMRVSPGTKLEIVRAIGPWYEIKTEQGIGFVHSRDIK